MSEDYKTVAFEAIKNPKLNSSQTQLDWLNLFVDKLQEICHEANKNWWLDLETGEKKPVNVGEKLCLIHSEISEAMEAHRKNLPDEKLSHRKGVEVELADALIRIFDLAGGLELDLAGAFVEKMIFNANRADHKIENRKGEHGKRY